MIRRLARHRLPVAALTVVILIAGADRLAPRAVRPAWSRPAQDPGFVVTTTGRIAAAGAVARHTVAISATGQATATVTLALGRHVWPVALPAAVVVAPRGRVTAVITVTVPFTATDRSFDTAEVTVADAVGVPVDTLALTTRTGGDFTGSGYVGCRFDLDRDGAVDADDLAAVTARRGAAAPSPRYDREMDLDGSGQIDTPDVLAVRGRVGRACRGLPVAETSALEAAITVEGIRAHLEALQSAAAAGGGHRAIGGAGYEGSLRYVEDRLASVGLASRREEVPYREFQSLETPRLEQVAPAPERYTDDDFRLLHYSGSGDVTAAVQAVDVVMPPGDAPDSSSSGCDRADFDGFARGRIALLQRGVCSFGEKVALAEEAGAAGVIIFNEGQPGRRDVFASGLNGPTAAVPAFSASYALGEALYGAEHAGVAPTLYMFARTRMADLVTYNLLADLPGRGSGAVLLGAHLDSVAAGPGINDNGSGAATILEIALQMARRPITPTNTVRFAFWGAEEIGLLGSSAHVARLDDAARRDVLMNLNFDMLGSPNFARYVYGTAGSSLPWPEGSAEIEAAFVRHFQALGLPTLPIAIDDRSDHGPFLRAGIPSGGLFTGTSEGKTLQEAELFGGAAGQSHDPCYHRPCDTVDNIDWAVLEQNADAAAAVTLGYAMDPTFAYHYAGDAPPAFVYPLSIHLPALSR
jgi:Zn-dependent M28 family amino/carboxypeptidase